jgi:CDP-diacylglycerol--serine O-phosphatidyltransferase
VFRFMNRANALTLLGLSAALGGALLALNGELHFGLVGLVVAGLADLFDGVLARTLERSEEEQTFGARLDSLCDAGSFGLAGALFLYAAGLRSPPEVALVIAFALCAVWRLAYFDTVGMSEAAEGAAPRFVGLPTTYVALVLPLVGLARLASLHALRVSMNVAALVLAVLMVSSLPIPKPGRKAYPLFVLIAVGAGTAHVLAGLEVI